MTIHILVEGPSERAWLESWVPRLLRDVPFKVHPHQGKGRLPRELNSAPNRDQRGVLDQLPSTLRALSKSLDAAGGGGILVLIDSDDERVEQLSADLQSVVDGLCSGSRARGLVRLAVEETEAFYLGDLKALERAFPNANMKLARAYEPDSICGTWELFGRIVDDPGHNKVAWGRAMGQVLTTNPAQSRSASFKRLIAGLLSIASAKPVAVQRKRAYRHPVRKKVDATRRR